LKNTIIFVEIAIDFSFFLTQKGSLNQALNFKKDASCKKGVFADE